LVAAGVYFQDGVRDDAKHERSEPKIQPTAVAA
jgi:hypothetical protein